MAEVYKGTGTRIARMAGKHAVMDEAAERVRAAATRRASQDRRTGAYSSNFKTARDKSPKGKGVVDRVVYNDHPAALAIELGHFAMTTDEEGRQKEGKFVPGKFNLLGGIHDA
ncbi:DUF5403 family protein [Corynebacterium mastitidis]|uniref:DUF5403 family protein n=1 Tax=Corynebacterium mastitidis TaxID=161890 RepID=UPI00254A894E|nr:DUF5403 family protein [Corynebacterium mastitidis]MDK8450990.1 DUF5403 family protein [Corynebacterium mastitidis]